MTNNTSRAFAVWAVPALVGMLSFPLCAQASEGADMPLAAPRAPIATAPAPAAPAAEPLRAAVPQPGAPSVPAPRAIAAGPVWSDASGQWRQVGHASWYGGRRWQGKLTASGARYDERLLTAAHASLPIGSQVRVTVADTGRAVVVTIIDRPGTRRRIIDLSRAAAAELGILSRGVATVEISPA